jgi:hypothetical protein
MATRVAVGVDYDLVISKNTLKGGSSPEERSRQRKVVDLGVSDSAFVHGVRECLKPGGLFMMYTISSAQGNAHCPFPEALLRQAGFEIVTFDGDDSPGAQAMTAALYPGRKSEAPLTALYTLVRKPPNPEAR